MVALSLPEWELVVASLTSFATLAAVAFAVVQAVLSAKERARLLTDERRLRSFAPLHFQCGVKNGAPTLSIQNPSTNTAYDVDAWVLGIYDEDDPVREKIEAGTKGKVNVTDEGFFCIFIRRVYYAFPAKTRVSSRLIFPSRPETIHVLAQFRDGGGLNYSQQYWFMLEDGQYRLGSLRPIPVRPQDRVDFDSDGTLAGTGAGDDEVPDAEFHELWKSRVSSRMIPGADRGLEGVGDWQDLA
jgi:hypothetical protein